LALSFGVLEAIDVSCEPFGVLQGGLTGQISFRTPEKGVLKQFHFAISIRYHTVQLSYRNCYSKRYKQKQCTDMNWQKKKIFLNAVLDRTSLLLKQFI